MRKLVNRYAGDDPLVNEALDHLRMNRLLDDAMEHMEQKDQIAIAKQIVGGEKELKAFMRKDNPSQSAEQQIARDYLMKGKLPKNMPPDRILGKDVTDVQLGIDGTFRPDSEVRRHVVLDIDDNGDLAFDRKNVRTEILSPQGIQESFDAWKPNAFNNNAARGQFNTAASEYYGQQALKLLGNTAVSDSNRSHGARQASRRGNTASTVGTDRLVENSVRLRDKDVKQSADFRMMTPEGKQRVLDYQVGTDIKDQKVNLNILKGSNLKNGDISALNDDMKRVAQKLKQQGATPDIDMIFKVLQDEGKLAPTVMDSRSAGTRPGKFMSDAPIMGEVNFDDQHRMEGVLFGMVDKDDLSKPYGMLPKQFRSYYSDEVRQGLGKMYADNTVEGKLFTKTNDGRPGNLYYTDELTKGSTGVFPASVNSQFSEPYSFDTMNKVVQMAQNMRRSSMPSTQSEIPF